MFNNNNNNNRAQYYLLNESRGNYLYFNFVIVPVTIPPFIPCTSSMRAFVQVVINSMEESPYDDQLVNHEGETFILPSMRNFNEIQVFCITF